ncbi:MAG: uracil-DNA glycosylase [Rhodobacterales bacterium CG15_BIG_FIL_POST_REV_8_21_14_020_59_13]|nr:MAG: uracil-DNA glycosylase [Rhodobacterales bacterium CG15_BIG_FIL_POST_REV_8_21_14_020_59_13]
MSALAALLQDIRACRACEGEIPEPRPVLQVSSRARIRIIGQAPGTRVHASGRPFTDPSGDRLRSWLKISEADFYNPDILAITPMGFCFPGLDSKGGDKPPRPRCARLWQAALDAQLPDVKMTFLIGGHAQKFVLEDTFKGTVTDTVSAWREYAPRYVPLPHPSWRNNAWLKRHDWFEKELLPMVQRNMESLLK